MDESTPRPIRVVQWATGNIGSRALRAVIEHPELELAGVYVTNPDKVGRDAGTLAGTGVTTGVLATGDADAIVALDADVALYMPLRCDFDEVCRLLAAGLDVVTTRGEFHHPASLDPDVRARVERACAEGGTSIHATGSSPGFITEAIPLVLTSIARRLDHLSIDEYADLSRRNSPGLVFDIMGFGKRPEELGRKRAAHLAAAFGPSLRVTAEALGLPLDAVEATEELALATRDVQIAAGPVPAGTVAGQRTVISGMRNGVELIRFRANWIVTTDIDADWDMQATGWRVQVAGDTPLDVRLEFAVPLERMAEYSPGYTAHRAVNAIAAVRAAAPGIRTSMDLPQVVARLGDPPISDAEAAELSGLVTAGAQDPNFLPMEADRMAGETAANAAHEHDAEDAAGLVGTPSHDPNFLPVETGRVVGEDDAGDLARS
ncbi:NAD(P)H-dependent amine dehydrogenase family protein [Trujillonella endophytica]|uniref:4-hydroxy-tetrahydrodipicolinate reductase n=1 Tax=Trujillonella endophytica TaxID=673521 RepID=A0A1H8UPU2_9ACTN|nr:dihydrodipicolinate reductase [Trujillella endophytica]SEP05202.1 4-hydroxy-tetrahydrodipicolinate reductase [Trujillella endophytica]